MGNLCQLCANRGLCSAEFSSRHNRRKHKRDKRQGGSGGICKFDANRFFLQNLALDSAIHSTKGVS